MRRSRRLPAAAVHEETRNGPGMNALKCIIIEDQTVRTRAGGSKLSVSAGSFYAIMAGEIVPDEYAAIIGIPCGLICSGRPHFTNMRRKRMRRIRGRLPGRMSRQTNKA